MRIRQVASTVSLILDLVTWALVLAVLVALVPYVRHKFLP
jgi:hypothetical protein